MSCTVLSYGPLLPLLMCPGRTRVGNAEFCGDGGIRTLDRPLQAYNGLANRRLQPLGHVSGQADMPDQALSRKRR